MAQTLEKQTADNKIEKDNVLEAIQFRNDTKALRQQIGIVADQSFREQFMSKQSFDFHRELVAANDNGEDKEKRGETKVLLNEVHRFAKEQQSKAVVIKGLLKPAVDKKWASEGDYGFLMKEITQQHDFVSRFEEAERNVKEKVKRFERDRKEYDLIVQDPLVRNTMILKTDPNTKIKVPNEKEYLGMTVPERRKKLEELKKAFPKAKEYGEREDSAEAKAKTNKYHSLLKAARRRGIIGNATVDKYMQGFGQIDLKEKNYWIKQIESPDGELARYQTLWKNIRGTLKGKALKHMEDKRDEMGYSQLLVEFGNVKEMEKTRLDKGYGEHVDGMKAAGIFSAHTAEAWKSDMGSQELDAKYHYMEEIEKGERSQELGHYYQLRRSIEGVESDDRREELLALYDSPLHGYTEINLRYKVLTEQMDVGEAEDVLMDRMEQRLAGESSENYRKNIMWNVEMVKDSSTRLDKMIQLVENTIRHGNVGRFDEKDYHVKVDEAIEARSENNQETRVEEQNVEVANDNGLEGSQVMDEVAAMRARKQKKSSLLGRLFGKQEAEEVVEDEVDRAPVASSQAEDDKKTEQLQKKADAPPSLGVNVKVESASDNAFERSTVSTQGKNETFVRIGIGDKGAVNKALSENVHHADLISKMGEKRKNKLEQNRELLDCLMLARKQQRGVLKAA